MKTEVQKQNAKYRVIVRNEITNETASFPIYEQEINLTEFVEKLESYIKKL